MTPDTKELTRICNNIERAIRRIPNKAAVMAVRFSKERFVKKNWIDRKEHPWTKTKKRRGSTLIKSGRLKRSIHKIHVGADYAIIGTDVPYARAHNDGGTFTGTETVRAHDREAHKRKAHKTRSGQRIKATTVRTHTVKSHQRKYSRTFIQRKFIGQSQYLTDQLGDMTMHPCLSFLSSGIRMEVQDLSEESSITAHPMNPSVCSLFQKSAGRYIPDRQLYSE